MDEISPDGLWRWDGTEWVPNAGTTTTSPVPIKKKMSTGKKVLIGGVGAVLALAALGSLGVGMSL